MANSLAAVLLRNCAPIAKRSVFSLQNGSTSNFVRHLYSKTALGLDAFVQQKEKVSMQMRSISEKFRQKMNEFSDESCKNIIFTEDLKNMIHLAENDDDITLLVKMMKKFNQQNRDLRFGTYVFGPVVMRLLHLHNKHDIALELFKEPLLAGFFDQLISYQILMDLLYENQKYDEMLETFNIIIERQIQGTKYPKHVVVLTMAACYKLNSKESLDFALKLWKDLSEQGHFPMRRATTFCAGLTVNQGRPDAALEILSTTRNQNYTTVRNIKALALAEAGRVEDAIPILKSILTEDVATNQISTFNIDVIERIKTLVSKIDNPDLSHEFDRLEKLFQKEGHISDKTLDAQLCSEIQGSSTIKNKQQSPFSRYEPSRNRYDDNNPRWRNNPARPNRPGLRDLM